MKNKLLFSFLILLIGFTIQAKSEVSIVDPVVTMLQDTTICPGNSATITVTGPANCTALIRTTDGNFAFSIAIGPAGTGTFLTAPLYQTTTYTLERITEFFTGNIYYYNDITVTISVIPNGCATITTNINVSPNDLAICNIGECRTLTATSTPIPSTSTYEVSAIPYCPQAAFTDPSYTQVNATGDDIWSAPITLPFNFSFFNQNYTSCQVGTNGIITFNPQTYPGFCDWNLNNTNLPSPAFTHLNAILGVFQDTETRTSGGQAPFDVSVNWKLTGTYPCRKLIVNFYHLGQYQCNQSVGLQTSQIVLYEISNIIEVYVQNRTRCTSWQNGKGVIGVINNSGTLAYVPPTRNVNDAWIATNEAWRFTPNGPNVPMTIRWLENGNQIASGSSVTVCPTANTSYVAEANYNISGVPFTVNSNVNTIAVTIDLSQNPNDISVCNNTTGSYVVDLTANDSVILGGLNPAEYEIYYFTSLADAQNTTNLIMNPSIFVFNQNQTIYAGVFNVNYGCYYIKPFQLSILDAVVAPTGSSPQSLNAGQTLANLNVSGQNIQWYDAPQGGNLLPNTTVVQNNATYYASQTVNDCESRTTQSTRLPILVQVTLGASEFDQNTFTLYPNPTNEIVTITSNLSDVTLDVFTILSQKIESKLLTIGTNTINLSDFTSGVYLFQLSLEGKTKTYKIVKN